MKKKIIAAKDGSMAVRYDDVHNVCIASSLHSLLQYILLFDDDIIVHHTCYMLGYGVEREVADKLPAIFFKTKPTANHTSIKRILDKLLIRIFKYIKFPFLRHAKIYALDWAYAPSLIGHRRYSLLADCPLFMSHNMNETSGEFMRQRHKQHTISGRIEGLLFGRVAITGHGDNPQCSEFFLTEENESPVLEGKTVHIASLQSLWDKASPAKKSLISKVFNVSDDDIDLLKKRDIMFMTQALITDNVLSEIEYLEILHKIFSLYDTKRLLIKTHPRDKFDYKRHFPDMEIYSKKVNIQLLILMGCNISRAVTICSSSINAFPESVEVDWFGVNIHPSLRSFYGDTLKPNRKYNQMQQ